MSLRLGLGIPLGHLAIGTEPIVDAYSPPVVIASTSDVVVVGAEALSVDAPLSIVTSKACQLYVTADAGVTDSSGVTAWADRSGNARHYAQGGLAATRASFIQANAAIGGRNNLRFDGAAQWLPNANWNPPSTATTPTWIRILARHISRSAASATLLGSNTSNRFGIFDSAASPNMKATGATSTGDCSMALGSWFVIHALLGNGAGTDYLHIGATKALASCGTIDATVVSIGGLSTGANFGNFDVQYVSYWNGEPTAPEIAAWNARDVKWFAGAAITYPS